MFLSTFQLLLLVLCLLIEKILYTVAALHEVLSRHSEVIEPSPCLKSSNAGKTHTAEVYDRSTCEPCHRSYKVLQNFIERGVMWTLQ